MRMQESCFNLSCGQQYGKVLHHSLEECDRDQRARIVSVSIKLTAFDVAVRSQSEHASAADDQQPRFGLAGHLSNERQADAFIRRTAFARNSRLDGFPDRGRVGHAVTPRESDILETFEDALAIVGERQANESLSPRHLSRSISDAAAVLAHVVRHLGHYIPHQIVKAAERLFRNQTKRTATLYAIARRRRALTYLFLLAFLL